MMEWVSTDLVKTIMYLLPGFLTAWIFYGLTAHAIKSPFERVVQALIFTVIIQGLTTTVRWCLQLLGHLVVLGVWTTDVAFVWSIVNATILGLGFAVLANKGWLHHILQDRGLTQKTSYPSEWYSTFHREKRYVILHLTGDRRLRGWPYEWPDQSGSGHFVMMDACWMMDDNECIPLHVVDKFLLPASDVEMVEFLKTNSEIEATEQEIEYAEQKLTSLHTTNEGYKDDGQQSTATTTDPAAIEHRREQRFIGESSTDTDEAPLIATPAPEKEVLSKEQHNGRATETD